MRRALDRRIGLGALLALVLGGCGGSAANPPPQALSATTSHGLSYSLDVTWSGKQQCLTASYRAAAPNGQPILQGSHLCGAPAPAGHPLLIQAHGSQESMIADVSTTGCATVRGGPTHAALRPLVTHCTTGKPQFRVTILPSARTLVITGIPGVPVLNFPRHRCRTGICLTPLA